MGNKVQTYTSKLFSDEDLERIREEYDTMNFHTSLQDGVLTVFPFAKRKYVKPVEKDETEEDKAKRVSKRERKHGFARD